MELHYNPVKISKSKYVFIWLLFHLDIISGKDYKTTFVYFKVYLKKKSSMKDIVYRGQSRAPL